MWRDRVTAPKTAESASPVPVPELLREILAEIRQDHGYSLAPPLGRPIDLHNSAARVVRARLARCGKCDVCVDDHDAIDHQFKRLPTWRGWYAFRRGLATLATSIDSQLAAKSLLRHSNVHTTQQFCIKSVPKTRFERLKRWTHFFKRQRHPRLRIVEYMSKTDFERGSFQTDFEVCNSLHKLFPTQPEHRNFVQASLPHPLHNTRYSAVKSACGTEGRGFKSRRSPQFLSQLSADYQLWMDPLRSWAWSD
jgi:hypothetical protein